MPISSNGFLWAGYFLSPNHLGESSEGNMKPCYNQLPVLILSLRPPPMDGAGNIPFLPSRSTPLPFDFAYTYMIFQA